MARTKPSSAGNGEVRRGGARTQFRKGRSGNPAGRPRGSRNKATVVAEKLLADQGQMLVERCVADALEGDVAMRRALLPYLLPVRPGRYVDVDFSATDTLDRLDAAYERTMEAMRAGRITLEEAERILALFERRRAMLETRNIGDRLAALEAGGERVP